MSVRVSKLTGIPQDVLEGLSAKKELDPLLLNKWTPFVNAYLLDPVQFRDSKESETKFLQDTGKGLASLARLTGISVDNIVTKQAIREAKPRLIENVKLKGAEYYVDGESLGHKLLPLEDRATQFALNRNEGGRRGGIGIKSFTFEYVADNITLFDAQMEVEFNTEEDLTSIQGRSLFELGQEFIIQFGWNVPDEAFPGDRGSNLLEDLGEAGTQIANYFLGTTPTVIHLNARNNGTSKFIRATHYSFDVKVQEDGATLGIYKLMGSFGLDLMQRAGVTKSFFEQAIRQLPTSIDRNKKFYVNNYQELPANRAKIPLKDISKGNQFFDPNQFDKLESSLQNRLAQLDNDLANSYDHDPVDYYRLGDVLEAIYVAYELANKDTLPTWHQNRGHNGITYHEIIGGLAVERQIFIVKSKLTDDADRYVKSIRENAELLRKARSTIREQPTIPVTITNVYEIPVEKDKVLNMLAETNASNKSLAQLYDEVLELLPPDIDLGFRPNKDENTRTLFWLADELHYLKNLEVSVRTDELEKFYPVFNWGRKHSLVDKLDFTSEVTPDLLFTINYPFFTNDNIIKLVSQYNLPQDPNSAGSAAAIQIQRAVNKYLRTHNNVDFIPNDAILNQLSEQDKEQLFSLGLKEFVDPATGQSLFEPNLAFRSFYSGVSLRAHGFVGMEGWTQFRVQGPIRGVEQIVYNATYIKHQITPQEFTTSVKGFQTAGPDLNVAQDISYITSFADLLPDFNFSELDFRFPTFPPLTNSINSLDTPDFRIGQLDTIGDRIADIASKFTLSEETKAKLDAFAAKVQGFFSNLIQKTSTKKAKKSADKVLIKIGLPSTSQIEDAVKAIEDKAKQAKQIQDNVEKAETAIKQLEETTKALEESKELIPVLAVALLEEGVSQAEIDKRVNKINKTTEITLAGQQEQAEFNTDLPPLTEVPVVDLSSLKDSLITNHIVKGGDTLGSIASLYNTTVDSIVNASNILLLTHPATYELIIDPNLIKINQTLPIPIQFDPVAPPFKNQLVTIATLELSEPPKLNIVGFKRSDDNFVSLDGIVSKVNDQDQVIPHTISVVTLIDPITGTILLPPGIELVNKEDLVFVN